MSVAGAGEPLPGPARRAIQSGRDRGLFALDVGSGPAVVLLHGQPGTSADWNGVVPRLVERFRVIAPDRPGYGRSGGAASGFADNAAAVVRLLDELGIDRALIVGHSWAGGVSLALARDHPDRVAGLVLAASVHPSQPPGLLDRFLATPAVGGLAAAVALTGTGWLLAAPPLRRRLGGALPGPRSAALAALMLPSPVPVWRSFAREQRALVSELGELAPAVGATTVPAAVLVGTHDRVVHPDLGRRLAADLPDGRLVELAGVGHLLPHDAPDAVAAAVAEVATRASGR